MKQSAGILVYKKVSAAYQILLVHPGGPFWAQKDSWSIPKGEIEADEDLLSGARREFQEEVGSAAPKGELVALGQSKQGSKTNHIWAVEGDVDLSHFHEERPSNLVTMEWPPHSGEEIHFAENDRVEWFSLSVAHTKVYKNQQAFLERLTEKLEIDLDDESSAEPETPTQQSLL